MTPAVVLGLFATGLGAVRSLARAGVPVVGMDDDPGMPGFRSRYCTALRCPDPVREPDRLVDALLRHAAAAGERPVLFPTTDAFVLFVSRHRDELAGSYLFALPDAALLEALVDKRRQYELAERAGVPYPRAFYPETPAEVESVAAEATYPVLVKPYYGHLWRETFGGEHKGFKAETRDELVDAFEKVFAAGIPAMAQEIVPGPNTNHFKLSAYVGRDGEPLAVFALRKIRQYPPEFGVGSLVESIEAPDVVDLGLKFLEKIDYRGIGSVELKRDERTGELRLIELNTRLWQQNSLATVCGMNFPLIQLLDLTGRTLTPARDYRAGVKWLDLIPDFQSFWAQRKTTGSGWGDWVASWRGTRAFSTFSWRDPMPFLHETRYGGKYLRLPVYLLAQRRKPRS